MGWFDDAKKKHGDGLSTVVRKAMIIESLNIKRRKKKRRNVNVKRRNVSVNEKNVNSMIEK